MQHQRSTLGLKRAPVSEGPDTAEAGHILRTAIAMRVCALATYNRTDVRLAPHILYTRHDEPFVDGVVVERDGKPPKELKLGSFKLAGLSDVRLTAIPFAPMALFDATAARYEGATIKAIDPTAV